ncbi:DUF1007 family protein [Moritella sp. F3]|uniref:DUF1007 family protein n=1 Tax=Moritella sp. F3 TaxID=2718882 RepID=UPI0018E1A5AE|nr:DUF1007 family protein [Moritella sp. F3]GIC78133.1 membrane protein [Moritella sp. F1]GIC83670.1 membrane protein [Moritella sp. F3]
MNFNIKLIGDNFYLFRKIMLMLLAFTSVASVAHPHSWVDMQTEIQGDGKYITGFKMSWEFDAMTSAYMLDGEDLSVENKALALQDLADSIMQNMTTNHYLTYFYEAGKPVKYALAENGTLVQDKLKARLAFYLPLKKPLILSDKTLKLLIYDPSYYVDMSWPTKNGIQLSPKLAQYCKLSVIDATPTSEQLAYVMSLPVDSSRDDALGELFTQTATINCQPSQISIEG